MLASGNQRDDPLTDAAGCEQQSDGSGLAPGCDEVGAARRGVDGRDVAGDDPVLGADGVIVGGINRSISIGLPAGGVAMVGRAATRSSVRKGT
jgi:hypothetical protein